MLNGSLEENVLTLLCHTEGHAAAVALQVTPALFSTRLYRKIARAATDYLESYGHPPQGHLRDLLEEDARKGAEGQQLNQVLDALEELATRIQPEFVLAELTRFVRLQQLERAIEKAADALHAGQLEEAQEALAALPEHKLSADPGAFLHDTARSLAFLQEVEEDFFPSGIPLLDDLDIRPMRKRMMVFIATSGAGKTWALINAGKHALQHRRSVLHITLEVPEEEVMQRYVQAVLARTKREAKTIRLPNFVRDEFGRLTDLVYDTQPEVRQPATQAYRHEITQQLAYLVKRPRLLVKEFPTGDLSTRQLNTYLDALERVHNFRPDLLIVDYPDLMQLDANMLRIDTGRVMRDLRGIAGRRNIALLTATQGNRASADAKLVRANMVAEDWSKISTADIVLTYSQTPQEHALNLARIFVAKARGARDKFQVLITQSYDTGQFCLDAVMMTRAATEAVARLAGGDHADQS